MNLLVRKMNSQEVCCQVAIGCYHPNAKGIRHGDPMKEVEVDGELRFLAKN
jgi:hypothetical protein